MDLEKRVQALEQEVEILKNQIQVTLLEIQEQLLTNTYPSLRSGNTTAPDTSRGTQEASATPPIKTFKPVEEGENDWKLGAGDSPVNVRKVSLDAFEPAPTHAEPAPQAVNWATLDEMEDWVSQKVSKMGADRTRQLIYMHHETGRIDDAVMGTLLQLVDLYDEEQRRPFDRDDDITQAAAPVGRSMPVAPPVRPAPDKTPARQPGAAVQPANARSRKTTAPKAPARKPEDNPVKVGRPPVELANIDESEPEERATILRLIAGVYNAGAGVKWGKKDG
ncbi:MAG: hypothetical protein CL610_13015 [Anaerolineaceae bacterium]|nr:hypothetical protein [Anaerolineaceae bacterium]